MRDCIIAMRSNSLAIKSDRVLRSVGIGSTIVSIDPSLTRRGCGIGLRIPYSDVDRAARELDRKKISYGDIIGYY